MNKEHEIDDWYKRRAGEHTIAYMRRQYLGNPSPHFSEAAIEEMERIVKEEKKHSLSPLEDEVTKPL